MDSNVECLLLSCSWQLVWIGSYTLLNAACKVLCDLGCHTTSLSCPIVKYWAARASPCEVDLRLSGKDSFYSKIPYKYSPVNVPFSIDKGMKGFTEQYYWGCVVMKSVGAQGFVYNRFLSRLKVKSILKKFKSVYITTPVYMFYSAIVQEISNSTHFFL